MSGKIEMLLSDAVGVVGRGTLTLFDLFYTARPELTWEAFPEAFTEVRFFEEGRFGVVPKWEVPDIAHADNDIREANIAQALTFSHKWFNTRETNINTGNILHLIGGDTCANASILGVGITGTIDDKKSNGAFVFHQNIINWINNTGNGFDPIKVNRKVTVHEIGHEFYVNTKDGADGHCSSVAHSDNTKVCIMGSNHPNFQSQLNNEFVEFDNDDKSTTSSTGKGDIYDVRCQADPLP